MSRDTAATETAHDLYPLVQDALRLLRSADTLASLQAARDKLADLVAEADRELERRRKSIGRGTR